MTKPDQHTNEPSYHAARQALHLLLESHLLEGAEHENFETNQWAGIQIDMTMFTARKESVILESLAMLTAVIAEIQIINEQLPGGFSCRMSLNDYPIDLLTNPADLRKPEFQENLRDKLLDTELNCPKVVIVADRASSMTPLARYEIVPHAK